MATTQVPCHGCQTVLTVRSDPVPDPSCWKGSKITPTMDGPFICDLCRKDSKKLKAAREAMEKRIGKEEPRQGFE